MNESPQRKFETNRRSMLKAAGAYGLATGVAAAIGGPGFAQTPNGKRLVVVLLRGGWDGLSLLVPRGDPNYADLRGRLTLGGADGSGLIPLKGGFALNPAAASLLPYWLGGSLSFIPAMASPYRGSNHFEASEVLETGSTKPGERSSGWLARASDAMGGGNPDAPLAVSLEGPIPQVLAGAQAASSWRPKGMTPPIVGFQQKLALLYRDEPLFGPLLAAEQREKDEFAESLGGSHIQGEIDQNMGAPSAGEISVLAETVGSLLARDTGPRVAVLQVGGWDTHFNQGGLDGALSRRIAGLAGGLAGLAEAMAPVWDKTAVLVMSEFGRTVTVNRAGGTGHGLGGLGLLMGGAVAGGQMVGKWPGLSPENLNESGGLPALIDSRAVIKTLLRDHLGLSVKQIDNAVMPGASGAGFQNGLIGGN